MATCPKCNTVVKTNQKFCNKCGSNLTVDTPIPGPEKGTAPRSTAQKEIPEAKPAELIASADIHEKRIAQDPLNANLYVAFGDLYRDHQYYEDALVQYQKAVSIDSTNSEGHLKSGNAYLRMGKLDRARDSFDKALKLIPDSLDARKGLFYAMKESGQFEAAVKVGKDILEREDSLPIHKALSDTYLHQGKDDAALIELQSIISTAADKATYQQLGELYVRQKDTEKVLESFKKVLEFDADDRKALYHVGLALYKKDDWNGSFVALERLLGFYDAEKATTSASSDSDSLSPMEVAVARLYFGYVELRLDRAKLGFAAKIKKLDQKVLDTSQLALLAECLAVEGDFEVAAGKLDDAIKTFQLSLSARDNITVRKKLAAAYAAKADLYAAKGDYVNARERYNQGLQYDQESASIRDRLNKLTSKRKKKKALFGSAAAVILLVVLGVGGYLIYDNFLNPNTFVKKIDRALSSGNIYSPPTDSAMDIYRAKKSESPDAKELKEAVSKIRQKIEPVGEEALRRFYTDSDDSDWDNVERIYSALSELFPDEGELMAKAEFCQAHKIINGREKKDYGAALSHYQKALQLKPNWVLAINGIAKVYVRKDSPFYNEWEALNYYTKACDTDPAFPWAYTNIAAIHSTNKRWDLAEQYLLKALAIKSDSASILRELGIVCERQSKPWEAKNHYQESMKYERNPEKLSWLQKKINSLL